MIVLAVEGKGMSGKEEKEEWVDKARILYPAKI